MAAKKKQRKIGKDNPDFDILEALASLPKPPPKNKGGRPRKYIEGVDPHFMVAFRHIFDNPAVDIDYFWEVARKAKTPKGRKGLRSQFMQEEKLIDEIEESYRETKDLAIQKVELDYKNKRALLDSNRREINTFKALIDDFELQLPSVIAQYALKTMAKFFAAQKAKTRHWRKAIQSKLPKKYQKLLFYNALSDWFYDNFGIRYDQATIRKAINEASS